MKAKMDISISKLLVLILVILMASCNQETSSENKGGGFTFSGTTGSNGSSYSIRPLKENPVVQRGSMNSVSAGMSMDSFLSFTYVTISPTSGKLNFKCEFFGYVYPDCFRIVDRSNKEVTIGNSGIISTSNEQFYQMNTFYLAQNAFETYENILKEVASATNSYYPSPLPSEPLVWNEDESIKIIPVCTLVKNNSYFNPVLGELCLGYLPNYSNVLFAQDPSVVYHEFAHVFIDKFFNLRNTNANTRPSFGTLHYDEEGALGEGIADYFSYVMTDRTHIGEWALGKFLSASRPMSEEDSIHQSYIRNNSNVYLNYPEFLNYDVYDPANPFEDIHYSGQIVSHFLVSLTKEIQSCSGGLDAAQISVMGLIAETLMEIGDLTAKGTDLANSVGDIYINHLNEEYSSFYSRILRTGSFRRFFQTFSRNFLHRFVYGKCIGKVDKDKYEQILDNYGLLLFSTYNDNFRTYSSENAEEYDITTLGFLDEFDTEIDYVTQRENVGFEDGTLTKINYINRQKTTLISKDQISLPSPYDNKPQAYVFDKTTDINNVLNALTFNGSIPSISAGLAGTQFNNGNGYISPGEVVGVSLNLLNNSNSPMAGVEVLATDWDHMTLDGDELKPCRINNWPLVTEGGVDPEDEETEGDCAHVSKTNGSEAEPLAPVCLVQLRQNNETTWVSQEKFKEANNFYDWECLQHQEPSNPTEVKYSYKRETDDDDDFGDDDDDFVLDDDDDVVADDNDDMVADDDDDMVADDDDDMVADDDDDMVADDDDDMVADDDDDSGDSGDSGDSVSTSEHSNKSCFVRVLNAGSRAFYSKIDPGKTLIESLKRNDGKGVSLNSSSAVFMEVNKLVPPGTTFMCRFRVKFNNCSNCHEDPDKDYDDYLDYEYSGYKPYKIINYQFTVID